MTLNQNMTHSTVDPPTHTKTPFETEQDLPETPLETAEALQETLSTFPETVQQNPEALQESLLQEVARRGKCTACELSKALKVPLDAVKLGLSQLAKAGKVEGHPVGYLLVYRLDTPRVKREDQAAPAPQKIRKTVSLWHLHAQKAAEEREQKRLALELEAKRAAEEREQKRVAEEREQKRLALELEAKRLAEEREQKRLALELEAKRLAEEREQKRLALELEAKRLAEERERRNAALRLRLQEWGLGGARRAVKVVLPDFSGWMQVPEGMDAADIQGFLGLWGGCLNPRVLHAYARQRFGVLPEGRVTGWVLPDLPVRDLGRLKRLRGSGLPASQLALLEGLTVGEVLQVQQASWAVVFWVLEHRRVQRWLQRWVKGGRVCFVKA